MTLQDDGHQIPQTLHDIPATLSFVIYIVPSLSTRNGICLLRAESPERVAFCTVKVGRFFLPETEEDKLLFCIHK
eukprot:scaffold27064_cov167-Skeletonema_menzelii.AAC.9